MAWTEAPVTAAGLASSVSAGHSARCSACGSIATSHFNPRYGALGLIALPQVWLFHFLLAALSPLVDLLFIWQLLASAVDFVQHGTQFNPDELIRVTLYYLAFSVVDCGSALLAFFLEKGEAKRLVALLPLQRLGYRQLLYIVVLQSMLGALRGLVVGWSKLERTSTVSIAPG